MAGSAILSIKILTDASKAAQGLDQAASKTSKFQSGLKKAAGVSAIALAGLGAAAMGAANAAAEDAQAQAVLANTLRKSAGATDDQIASTEDWISKTAMATGVADDQLRPALGALVRATGDVSKAQEGMGQALDIAAATGADVESVSKAMAKGYAGNTAALGKLVPGIDKATLASGDMSKVMDEVSAKTGGAAAAAADTAAGRMARMKVSMDEAKESMGAGLLPIMSLFATILGKVGLFVQKHTTTFQILAVVIAVVAAAVMVLNVAMTILAANPVVLIIVAIVVAIGLLVAAVVLLVKNWDTVWGKIASITATVMNKVKSVFTTALNAVKAAFASVLGWVRSNWPLILALLTGPVGIAVGIIVKNWDKVTTAIDAIKGAIKDVADAIGRFVSNTISGLGETLSKPWNVFKSAVDAVKGAIDAVVTAIGNVISKIAGIHFPKPPGWLSRVMPGMAMAPPVTGVSSRATGPAPAAASSPIVINVTGAIDPEATARQIRRILAGHDRRIGLATS